MPPLVVTLSSSLAIVLAAIVASVLTAQPAPPCIKWQTLTYQALNQPGKSFMGSHEATRTECVAWARKMKD